MDLSCTYFTQYKPGSSTSVGGLNLNLLARTSSESDGLRHGRLHGRGTCMVLVVTGLAGYLLQRLPVGFRYQEGEHEPEQEKPNIPNEIQRERKDQKSGSSIYVEPFFPSSLFAAAVPSVTKLCFPYYRAHSILILYIALQREKKKGKQCATSWSWNTTHTMYERKSMKGGGDNNSQSRMYYYMV